VKTKPILKQRLSQISQLLFLCIGLTFLVASVTIQNPTPFQIGCVVTCVISVIVTMRAWYGARRIVRSRLP
jgi:hypothetical protein